MGQFEYNGILYEELPNGKARVIGPVGQSAVSQPPGYIPPNPNSPRAQERAQEVQFRQQDQQRDAERHPGMVAGQGLTNQGKAQDNRFQPSKQTDDLIKSFTSDPAVKAYREATPVVIAATQAQPGGAGDISVLYGWAKAMDPAGTVRQGETELATSAVGPWQRVQHLSSKYRLQEGGVLPPDLRFKLIEEMRIKARQLNVQYSEKLTQYRELARRAGLDPDLLGPHEGEKFIPAERAYVDSVNKGRPGPTDPTYDAILGGPRAAKGPTQEGFDLKQDPTIGEMTPEQQSAYKAFWSANPNPTPEQLNGFFQSVGLGPAPNAESIIQAVQEGRGFSTTTKKILPADLQQRVDERLENTGAGGAGVAGAMDTTSIGTFDELSAFADSIGDAVDGKGWRYGDNLDATRQFQQGLQDQHGGAYLTGQIAGGLVLPTFGARGAAQLGKVGAGYGAAYGGASGEDVGQRITGAAIGGGGGGAIGYGLGRAAEAAGGMVAPRGVDPRLEAVDGADALGIQLMPADVGGPGTRAATAANAQTMLGAGPIVNRAQHSIQTAANARTNIAGRVGEILPQDEAGAAVRKGGRELIDVTGKRGGALYDRVAEMTGGEMLPAPNAVRVIDEHIASLSEAGDLAAPVVTELQKLRRFVESGATVNGLRQARTLLRGLSETDALRKGPAKKIFGDVLEAVSTDIQAGLHASGKAGAARMLQVADRFWRERVEHIDEVLEPIIGNNKSGEDIMRAVERMVQGKGGGVSRLSRLMASLPEDEAANVRATLINRIGRTTSESGENLDSFSAARFVTHWDENMSAKAKAVLFGNGEQRKALDQLAAVARQMKASDKYRNFSNSGGAAVNALSGGGAVAAIMGGQVPLMVGIAALNYASARLLSSPAFVKTLTNILRSKANPQQALSQVSKLAAKNPALRGEIQQLVTKVANDNTLIRSAASDSNPENQQ